MSVQTSGLPSLSANANHQGEALFPLLTRAKHRIRTIMLLRFGALALLITSLLGVGIVGLSKLHLFDTPSPLSLGVLIVVGVLIGCACAFWPRLSELDVAKLTERRADLKERLSSAMEFRQQGFDPAAPFYGEQWTDANASAAQVQINTLFPVRIPRTLPIGALLSVGLFLMFFLPTLPAFWSPKQRKDAEDVKVTAIAIQKVAEDTQKAADTQKLDEAKKAAQDTKTLANKMKMGKLNKKESLVELQKLTKKFEEQQKKLEDGLPKKSMEEASKQFKQSLDQMQKEMERAKQEKNQQANANKPMTKDGMKPQDKAAQDAQKKQDEAMKQMQQALQQMAQALQNTQMQQMSQQMQQLAQQMQQMQQMGQLTPEQMQQLADALKKMAGMCKNPGKGMPTAMMDAKALAELLQALKDGKMTMCMGTKPGTRPGMGGKGPGMGVGGHGSPTNPMKDPGATKPKMLVANQSQMSKALGKQGDAKEFAKYLAMSSQPSKVTPNGVVNGNRTQQGDELQLNMTGDPDPTHSSAPYYKAYETSKHQAESTLDKENVPAAYKKQVKDYFDSIHP